METEKLLREHVKESNAIENIFVRANHHLFVDHLSAADLVVWSARKLRVFVQPADIHLILMKRELPTTEAGHIRTVRVRVGPYLKPQPEDVEILMKIWKTSLQRDLQDSCSWTPSQKEKSAWHYHHWFESIHPFVDGNGRTGRLILNNIRLLFGLPWLIVHYSERENYYQSIREWEAKNKKLLEIH